MATRRLAYIGAFVCLALALALHPVAARAVHPPTHPRPAVSILTRISRASARREKRPARERIIVVVTISGRGFAPDKKFTIQNSAIIRVNGKSQAVTLNAGSLLESEHTTTLTVQADGSGALSTDILINMNGPAEHAGTVNIIGETASISDRAGQQLAITGVTATVTSQ